MIGKEKELVKRIQDKNTKILTYQCIIHQHLLVLSVTLKEVMDGLVKLINFIRSRSPHGMFKEFLCEYNSAYSLVKQRSSYCTFLAN